MNYNYPLSEKQPQKVRSKTGKLLQEITVENILEGNINADDIKISKETLLLQGEIAEAHGRSQLKENFVRASELTEVPDEWILKIYEMLRPHRSSFEELKEAAKKLREDYDAENCAKLLEEAAEVYKQRGILK
jgi:propanediol dehydratase small subunit